MPGVDSRYRPPAASDFSVSDEACQLELHLQRQLEDDVARIFDESIYSDLEVVCGKLKILTHSCILKARTKKFYHKLKTILHVNITRSTFDEIYSYVSDTYTECNIINQEKEILNYLKTVCFNTSKKKKDADEHEEFLTPKCTTPFKEKALKKSISSSPSTELKKEYYALVPIEGHLLEKELIEQDVLSSGFQSIISSQIGEFNKVNNLQRIKPTSLALVSSHTSKTVKHSNSCDILSKNHLRDDILSEIDKDDGFQTSQIASQKITANQLIDTNKSSDFNNLKCCENVLDKTLESAYSPDSLITDDPSSASDYLSAAFTCSPGISFIGPAKLNVEDNITKMENFFTSSDSGLENTGLLESISSHRDVTLTDMSLTESTLHDFTTDDGSNSHDSTSSPVVEKKNNATKILENYSDTAAVATMSTENTNQTNEQTFQHKDMSSCSSSKEEKQRKNEEIVVLESSSLSSETGSWESVFPPKLPVKEACEKFIRNERQHFNEVSRTNTENISGLVQKSPFKSASCFIDAASLLDDEEEAIHQICDVYDMIQSARSEETLPAASRPVPCSTNKTDLSPNDWSENDNEDSLEQLDNKDPDSIQKDASPTMFEMTPITEDSLCTNAFEQGVKNENSKDLAHDESSAKVSTSSGTVLVSGTPHNSILSLKTSALKQYESEESESDSTIVGREGQLVIKNVMKHHQHHEASPIISGGASIEDHLPTVGSYTGSPMTRRRMENAPILSGAYIPPPETESSTKSPRPPSAPAWVVDMSSTPISKAESLPIIKRKINHDKPVDKTCENLRNYSKQSSSSDHCSKSRSSVDSDSSDKSSHKFYIDLSSIPDPAPSKTQNESESLNEKKNMFSLYFDYTDKVPLKEMPARLSSLSTKKNNTTEPKNDSKNQIPATSIDYSQISISSKDATFERYESLCNDPNISITEIIRLHESYRKEQNRSNESQAKSVGSEKVFLQNLQSAIQEEEPNVHVDELFVKLSDLDKPLSKHDGIPRTISRPLDERMTRSIPEHNWSDQNQSFTSRSNEVINSFHSENAQSLNRLFPHLRNEFSRSMPGSLSSRTRSPLILGTSSPGDILDDQASDTSELSSMQSSICRSIVEHSTEETSQASSLVGQCQSRLGQDLLRMFLEEIAPDVIVEVSGRRIKAHKCILSSRCQYFAGILSGGWVESAGNVIALPPFSYNVVHFALCHIYSGAAVIPDAISIVELATLADMLSLEGLKEAIMFTLKAKYCHHFHNPCVVCTAGVLECFPLSSLYGLDDLYRKCLKWIAKYFSVVWPTKAFATLPSELLEKCLQQVVLDFNIDIIVDYAYGCGITVDALHTTSKWAEVVIRLSRRLNLAVAHFIAPKLVAVLRDIGTLPPDPPAVAMQGLQECMAAAIEWAPPDELCRAYALLTNVVRDIRNNRYAKPDLIINGNFNVPEHDNLLYVHAGSWILQCEGALVRAAPRVCCTQAFIDLPSDLRRRLRELGCIIYGGQGPLPAPPPAAQNRRSRSTQNNSIANRNQATTSKSLDIDQMRASFVPYAPKPPTQTKADTLKNNSTNVLDDKKVPRPAPPQVRTTKAQEERAKYNMTKTLTPQERKAARAYHLRAAYDKMKPKYPEPLSLHSQKPGAPKKLVSKMISSSESSRNSSPIQARNLRTSRMKTRQAAEPQPAAQSPAPALSQDSLATGSRPRTAEPSTDSPSESQTSKYATYTKAKHSTKASTESTSTTAKVATAASSASTSNGKARTKIPVYSSQNAKANHSDTAPAKSQSEAQKKPSYSARTSGTTTSNTSVSLQPRQKLPEKSASCSLMNATKSSSAKMVTKVVRDAAAAGTGARTKVPTKTTKKRNPRRAEHEPPAENIPVMERSGTFLKDEPTFGNNTKNIDLDQSN